MENEEHKTAIDVRDLTAGYGEEVVIEDVDLRVQRGDFFGLIGPNGGGEDDAPQDDFGADRAL